jgi:hypothetical protein
MIQSINDHMFLNFLRLACFSMLRREKRQGGEKTQSELHHKEGGEMH